MNWTSFISIWWLIPVAAICFLLARVFYQKKGWIIELSPKMRSLLIGLRALVLFSLVLLLFGIVFEYKSYRDEKPILINILDNSSSVLNYKDSSEIKKQLATFENSINTELADKYSLVSLPLFEEGKDPKFKGEITNISSHLEMIRNLYVNRNIGAIIITSDGNYNQGSNPIYTAEGFNFVPFYTLAIGDTVQKKDQLIKDVVANEYAYLKNNFPIEVEVEGRKVKNLTTSVELYEGNRLLQKQTITFTDDFAFKQVAFQLTADKIGIHRYTVKIPAVKAEYNLKNNQRDFYVEILDSRNKILLLTEAPHPDITAVKATLETNENIEVQSELISKWDKKTENLDLVVWHEPGNNPNQSVFNLLKDKRIPVLFFIGPNSSSINFLKSELGIGVPNNNQIDELQPLLNKNFDAFSISDELRNFLSNVPPLNSRYGKFILPNSSLVFLNQRIGPIEKQDPLQFFYQKNNTKYGVVLGEGIWKWRLNDYVKNESFLHFDEWVNKTCQYLITKENKAPFVVQLPKRFDKNQDVIVNAELYDKSMELTNKEIVYFELKDENGRLKKFSFAKTDKAYRLFLGKLKPGFYNWIARTSRSGQKLSKSGSFIVNDLQIEDLDNEANHAVLRQISEKTKGSFALLNNPDQLIKSLKNRPDIATVSYAESNFLELIDWRWFFVLLLFAFGTEWFLRKWWGGY
ncbi:MAG: hypothetical protein KJ941_12295 [Bacteroidetes bacterium]|nr:hypothetical protein [Bacteroidota bacterium]